MADSINIGVVGCRHFQNYILISNAIDTYLNENNIDKQQVKIVSGGANGIDYIAKMYSKVNNLIFIEHKPDHSKGYHKRNYAIRNQKIVDDSDILLAFPSENSVGTYITTKMGEKKGIPVVITIV